MRSSLGAVPAADRPRDSNFKQAIARVLLVSFGGLPVFLALALFLPAGRWDWAPGWRLTAFLFSACFPIAIWLWRTNPEIYVARSRIGPGTPAWDWWLLTLLLPSFAAIFVVAGLDAGRFGWSRMAWGWQVGGYALVLAGTILGGWSEGVNKFFEPSVRIQTERGHRVVDRGPYAWVRHPGYFGANLFDVGVALALGSWWALLPAALACVLLVIRTYLEEVMLLAELPGYKEYAARVRFRWVPGVW